MYIQIRKKKCKEDDNRKLKCKFDVEQLVLTDLVIRGLWGCQP